MVQEFDSNWAEWAEGSRFFWSPTNHSKPEPCRSGESNAASWDTFPAGCEQEKPDIWLEKLDSWLAEVSPIGAWQGEKARGTWLTKSGADIDAFVQKEHACTSSRVSVLSLLTQCFGNIVDNAINMCGLGGAGKTALTAAYFVGKLAQEVRLHSQFLQNCARGSSSFSYCHSIVHYSAHWNVYDCLLDDELLLEIEEKLHRHEIREIGRVAKQLAERLVEQYPRINWRLALLVITNQQAQSYVKNGSMPRRNRPILFLLGRFCSRGQTDDDCACQGDRLRRERVFFEDKAFAGKETIGNESKTKSAGFAGSRRAGIGRRSGSPYRKSCDRDLYKIGLGHRNYRLCHNGLICRVDVRWLRKVSQRMGGDRSLSGLSAKAVF